MNELQIATPAMLSSRPPSLRKCFWRLYELAKDNEDQPAEAEEEGAVYMGYKNWLVCIMATLRYIHHMFIFKKGLNVSNTIV